MEKRIKRTRPVAETPTKSRIRPAVEPQPIKIYRTKPTTPYVDEDDIEANKRRGETDYDVISRILAKYRRKARSPLKAIRGFCIHCMGGYVREVARCTATKCLLYPFRMGRNPFGKHKAGSGTKKLR